MVTSVKPLVWLDHANENIGRYGIMVFGSRRCYDLDNCSFCNSYQSTVWGHCYNKVPKFI